MKIKIKTLSPTLVSSGEPSGLIDNDIIFDSNNLPFIPAKRLKGLLKESALEVLEILNINERDTIFSLFGSPDRDKESKLDFRNIKLEKHKKLSDFIDYLLNNVELLDKSNVLDSFTSLIQQTSIDDQGIAKEGSLRLYRVLDKDLNFEGEIFEKELSDKEKALIFLAAKNLKRIGLRRNRGFGHIKITIPDLKFSIEDAIKILKTPSKKKEFREENELNFKLYKSPVKSLELEIKTLSPVVITKSIGEQNTVNTQNYITGSSIRGMIANIFLEKLKISEPHKNKLFEKLFLKECIFTNAYPFAEKNEFYPNSYAIQRENRENPKIYNLIEYPEIVDISEYKIKPFSVFINFENGKIIKKPILKKQFFHSSRYKDRSAGRSTDAGIFYYEAIEENQNFKGYIYGEDDVLKNLKNIIGDEFIGKLGRSKLSQYGTVYVKIGEVKEINSNIPKKEKITITAISPIILLNHNGFPSLDISVLKEYLIEKLGNELEIENILVRTTNIENFVNTWTSKTPSFSAYSEGSTFVIKGNIDFENLKNLEIEGIGEFTNLGYGQIKINWLPENKDFEIKDIKKSPISKINDVPYKLFKNMLLSSLNSKIESRAVLDAKEKLKNFQPLSNSLIHKLIILLEISKDKNQFLEKLNKLRNTAKNKIDKTDIFEIKDKEIKFEEYEKPVKDILNEIKIKESSSKDLLQNKLKEVIEEIKKELYKNYWITFFKTILKLRRGKQNEF